MAHHSTSTSMHVNPVAQSYKQQAEGEDKRLIERGELKRCRPSTVSNRCLIAPSCVSPYFFDQTFRFTGR